MQGAKRAGMHMVWTREYEPFLEVTPSPGDSQPDAQIASISELPGVLGGA